MSNNQIYALLGLSKAGRNLVSGEFSTEEAIKKGKAFCVIVAADASDNTKKNFKDSCTYYGVPFYVYGTKDELGHAIGCQMRASVAVTDSGLAAGIMKKLDVLNEA